MLTTEEIVESVLLQEWEEDKKFILAEEEPSIYGKEELMYLDELKSFAAQREFAPEEARESMDPVTEFITTVVLPENAPKKLQQCTKKVHSAYPLGNRQNDKEIG